MQYTYAFEKMSTWQMARQIAKMIYLKTKDFPKEELFGITNQIRRASISTCFNLSEGSARLSRKEQERFYEIAFGSAVEVVNLLILCKDLNYLSEEIYSTCRGEMERLTFSINKLTSKKPSASTPSI